MTKDEPIHICPTCIHYDDGNCPYSKLCDMDTVEVCVAYEDSTVRTSQREQGAGNLGTVINYGYNY